MRTVLLLFTLTIFISGCKRERWVVNQCPAGDLDILPDRLQSLNDSFFYVSPSGELITMLVTRVYSSEAFTDSCHEVNHFMGFDTNKSCDELWCSASSEIELQHISGSVPLNIVYHNIFYTYTNPNRLADVNVTINDDYYTVSTQPFNAREDSDSLVTNVKIGERTYDELMYMEVQESWVNQEPTARYIFYSPEYGVVGFELWETGEFFYLK